MCLCVDGKYCVGEYGGVDGVDWGVLCSGDCISGI